MATFILIHGAWHWGGCFVKVANILARHGHAAIMPDLAGHGFDSTPLAEITSIERYAASARAALEAVDGKAVLVGHSVGGATCTWLGELMPEKVAALVYLTGFMAPAGKSARDYVMTPTYARDPAILATHGLIRAQREGLAIDLGRPDLVKAALYSDCSDHDISVATANLIRLTPHTPFVIVSKATPGRFGRLPRHYIECLDDNGLPLSVQRLMQADLPGTVVHPLRAGHSPFLSAPGEVAALLMGVAG